MLSFIALFGRLSVIWQKLAKRGVKIVGSIISDYTKFAKQNVVEVAKTAHKHSVSKFLIMVSIGKSTKFPN